MRDLARDAFASSWQKMTKFEGKKSIITLKGWEAHKTAASLSQVLKPMLRILEEITS